ncbi:hypothetical protein CcaCcLH18_04683 [Colletotrichum camelliae]|nr:hypothetical protein CcaCcLH18_04683 [Colletotrichum camelliae]
MASLLDKADDTTIIQHILCIFQRAVTGVFGGAESGHGDVLSIYRWAIANKAARQTTLLEDFRERRENNTIEGMSDEGKEELKIALELADIIDELYMIQRVLEQQHGVAQRFPYELNISSACRLVAETTYRQVETQLSDVKTLIADAERAHKMVLELLDLEQKAASLGEARITTKQGQAVMLFTVITVIFLPLSFFVSYFGQNVSELTGDAQNPTSGQVWKIAAPISVVVILGSLAVAFFITYPDSVKSCLRRKKTNGTSV